MFVLRNNGNLWITKQNGKAWAPTCHKVQSSDVPPLFAEPELWTQWWETLQGWVRGAGHWATAVRPWEDRKESCCLLSRVAWVMAAFSHGCYLLPDTLLEPRTSAHLIWRNGVWSSEWRLCGCRTGDKSAHRVWKSDTKRACKQIETSCGKEFCQIGAFHASPWNGWPSLIPAQ